MRLNCINLVSTEPERLRSFYAMILQKPYNEIVPGRSEILVGEVKLVFTRTSVQTPVNPDSCGLEFVVEDVDAQGRCRIEQRNKFSVGEMIEIMKPDGRNVEVTVRRIVNEDGQEQESAPHAKQTIYVDLGAEADLYDILRRKEEA